jgi:hypothetical protein
MTAQIHARSKAGVTDVHQEKEELECIRLRRDQPDPLTRQKPLNRAKGTTDTYLAEVKNDEFLAGEISNRREVGGAERGRTASSDELIYLLVSQPDSVFARRRRSASIAKNTGTRTKT